MAVLCFLLDLLSISPPLLRDLKQALLQLANFYAISPWRHDRIGLCYLLYNRISSSNELKIAYSPRENFGLRDFHHAVNSLPTDVFFPQTGHSGPISSADLHLSTILSDEVLYSWGGKDIVRKIILLSSCFVQNIDSTLQNTLMEAADKCVLVEFVLFEQKSSHLSDIPDNIDNFAKQIHDLDNCSLQTYPPDVCVLHGLVKRWLQDLKDDIEEPLQACFIFKTNLVGSVNQISCNFSISFNHITDGFSPCQTCRCHGIPLDDVIGNKIKVPSCWVTGVKLGTYDLIENFVKIGEQTMLFLPSFKSFMKLQQVSSPIDFNIIERTNLGSLSEVFQGLCSTLRSLDQGLVCSSICNLETMREAAFHCYYILYPSDGGPMLLRRLAGSEEVSPIPDVSRVIDSSLTKEIENSIESSLLKMELRDYNPVLHERGFHQKLNFLVKESLQFRSIPPKLEEVNSELNLTEPDSLEVIAESNSAIDVANAEGTPQLDVKAGEDKATATIAEEWEQLIVNEVPNIYSPSCICKPKLEQSVLLPSDSTRQLDVKTSRILERLEIPRQLKKRALSPIITNSIMADGCALMKKPLIPFQPIHVTAAGRASIASKPMKPNFQRKHG
ncbi:uncharacterized protein LOC100242180 isoform X2 [Vitis vinifera]|uniref:uncharacterized protein LOC100242180 isoform X2 n=1 Tax=Vitis vinifera TaxID=29760 RepID=UPI0005402E5F|nr:uncharacterized protein LOC100242180 isoform X2 [Vitis vinifera]|eukprot:XP_010656055.1 PREDICTED: uncharacterized protein LOC100242180 isoform X4 [Vitis vinifera]